ncbi:DUF2199 domain-containing protein [Terriglobus saanensis]|uniref:DUF2199 domain-containing protein n=1 Tax=Terriglobus saanensis (strain ATCC BAA-1853 / DSM 23119 / SP1PR4) TaxID=401053 RepID=E8V5E5_TERSS|nr:DUF2199 domain-containing protein [Terriglobus saanensis]ADV84904.1 Protein of unknown function DUF2199 [Terriglobus saanensis SP1PR4]
MDRKFTCSVCGEVHESLPLSYNAKIPDALGAIPEMERASRAQWNADQCVLDGTRFFLRGRILLPITDAPPEPLEKDGPNFVFGVWAELDEATFLRVHEKWFDPQRVMEPFYPARMHTSLFLYPETRGLELLLQTRAVGRRPHITVRDAGHPLYREQRDGITMEQIQGFAERMLHRS